MKDGKTCKICSKTFTRRNYLQKHIENIHSKRYSCPTCFRYFAGPTEHSCATKNGRFACYVDKCSLRFASGMSLRLHVRDGHRKVDENLATGDALKTKKDARNMVKMLCKKINVLSKCFDELKYQLDNVNECLRAMGYELPLQPIQKDKIWQEEDMEYDDLDDYIDFNEDGFVEEVPEENVDNRSTKSMETENIQTITLCSNAEAQQAASKKSHEYLYRMKEVSTERAAAEPTIQIPPVARVGSTIISQLPFKIVPIKVNKIVKPTSTSNSAASKAQVAVTTNAGKDKTPPPLFLKIQYESETETAVCKNDPKITFHFETGPLDQDDKKGDIKPGNQSDNLNPAKKTL